MSKTYALLLEPLRHILSNPGFYAVVFRRNTTQVTNPGGLWDASLNLYTQLGGKPLGQPRLEWRFPGGGKLKFSHLQDESSIYSWQGSEVALFLFDELCHFSKSQFFYMLTRNRTTCGVRPYVRATCNPDADSWVADFISWWIDQDTGYPIEERSGIIRWFLIINDETHWGDSAQELIERFRGTMPEENLIPKSLTFIRAKLTDNPILMARDPAYMGNLLAQNKVERERLLGGNWKIRPCAGMYFQRLWATIVEEAPQNLRVVRGWDLAATPKTETNDPDWTTGTKIGVDEDGVYYVLDHVRVQQGPRDVQNLVKMTANHDGVGCAISIAQDPGQAGKSQADSLATLLAGYTVRFSPETGDKIVRFGPFSAQAERKNVRVVRGKWNEKWFDQLESFPEALHDDDADSTSRAFAFLANAPRPAYRTNVVLRPR